MELVFAPKGILQIDNARIIHRNFAGVKSQYNREGARNFSLVIPDEEIANALIEDGWNVKIREAKQEGDTPLMYLPVKLSFNDWGPDIYLKSGEAVNKLKEEDVGELDKIDILSVDMDIRPYDWEVNGKSGRTAYVHSLHVEQRINRFAARYAGRE